MAQAVGAKIINTAGAQDFSYVTAKFIRAYFRAFWCKYDFSVWSMFSFYGTNVSQNQLTFFIVEQEVKRKCAPAGFGLGGADEKA